MSNLEPLFDHIREALRARPGMALMLPGVELREAAVLIPLVSREDGVRVVFTRRPMTLRTHAGQISFPGGARDSGDPTPLHTALRESHEELGIEPTEVRVLGMLDELPTITRYRVVPFVGVLSGAVSIQRNPHEVDEVIEVPLDRLAEPARHRREQHGAHELHFYHFEQHVIWGVTGRILTDLLDKTQLRSALSLRAG